MTTCRGRTSIRSPALTPAGTAGMGSAARKVRPAFGTGNLSALIPQSTPSHPGAHTHTNRCVQNASKRHRSKSLKKVVKRTLHRLYLGVEMMIYPSLSPLLSPSLSVLTSPSLSLTPGRLAGTLVNTKKTPSLWVASDHAALGRFLCSLVSAPLECCRHA